MSVPNPMPRFSVTDRPLCGCTRIAGVFLLAAVLGGCGFHLRTYELASNVDSYFVESSTRARIRGVLENGLRVAGVERATSSESADVVIQLIDGLRERRSATVTGLARVAEYEVAIELEYAIEDGTGVELLAAQRIRVERVYQLDPDNIVGSSEERALIERELETDLVQQVIRSLNAVTRTDREDPA